MSRLLQTVIQSDWYIRCYNVLHIIHKSQIEAADHTSIINQEFEDFSRDIWLLNIQKRVCCELHNDVEMQIRERWKSLP